MSALTNTSTEEMSMQSWRALIGWLNDQEVTQYLLGRQATSIEEVALTQQVIAECRTAVASRPTFTPVNPIIDGEDDEMFNALQYRDDIQAAFAGLEWHIATVNLREVLAFQKLINTEGLETRLAAAQSSKEDLFELCLPTNQPLPPSGAMLDQDGKSVTVSSLNLNLRISGFQAGAVQTNPDLPSTQAMALTFLVTMGTSYLQVGK